MSKHRIPGVISDNTSNFFVFHQNRREEEATYETIAEGFVSLEKLIAIINSMPIGQEKTDAINKLKTMAFKLDKEA